MFVGLWCDIGFIYYYKVFRSLVVRKQEIELELERYFRE